MVKKPIGLPKVRVLPHGKEESQEQKPRVG